MYSLRFLRITRLVLLCAASFIVSCSTAPPPSEPAAGPPTGPGPVTAGTTFLGIVQGEEDSGHPELDTDSFYGTDLGFFYLHDKKTNGFFDLTAATYGST